MQFMPAPSETSIDAETDTDSGAFTSTVAGTGTETEPEPEPEIDAGYGLTRSLRRAVGLLRLLSTHTQIGWRLTDLAERSALDRATVHRLLAGLCAERLVTRVPGPRHYTLGPLAYELGIAAQPYYDLGALAASRLEALARELQGSVFLKVLSGVDSVCVARHDGADTGQALMLYVGGRRPLCLTAGGVAMLIRLTLAQQEQIASRNHRTIGRQDASRLEGVRRMLDRSRVAGFGLNLGDVVPSICAVSIPILDRDAVPVASLSLALAVPGLTASRVKRLAERLQMEALAMAPALERLRF